MRMTVLNQHLKELAKGPLLPVPAWFTTPHVLMEYNCNDLEQHCASCNDNAAYYRQFALCRQGDRDVTSSRR